jgi:hypothetical protein
VLSANAAQQAQGAPGARLGVADALLAPGPSSLLRRREASSMARRSGFDDGGFGADDGGGLDVDV